MKLSAQEEYGLRCLLQLARNSGSLTLTELSKAEGISLAHAGKLMRLLRRGGLVTATRGQTGGYALARPAGELMIGDVLAVLGGRFFDAEFCDRHAGVARSCTHLPDCSIRPVLRRLQDVVDGVLGQLPLSSLLPPERDVTMRAAGPRAVSLPLLPS
jgi:Rrf2 family protein